MTNKELYGDLPKISDKIRERRARFAGHCFRRSDEAVTDLLHWIPKHGQRKSGRPPLTFIELLKRDTGFRGRGAQDSYAGQKVLEGHHSSGKPPDLSNMPRNVKFPLPLYMVDSSEIVTNTSLCYNALM